ncbi:MAG TPA: tetratricopeptide repeat protein [Chryseosolibacter sp.]
METRSSFPTVRLFLFACLIGLPQVSLSQDAEKQKIIDVITGELDAWYTKDREKWINAIVPSKHFQLTSVSPEGYYFVHGFDSLVRPRENYFKTPADPNVKRITKSEFKVDIKGSIAIVDLVHRGEDFLGPYTADQTIIMEKIGKSWKILRQHGVIKSRFELKESNIEGVLNSQGYRYMQLKKIDEAIKVFTLNTELFPNAWNTWDSLADAYKEKGEKQLAIGFFKKSIALNPDNAYGKKMIAQLEENQ